MKLWRVSGVRFILAAWPLHGWDSAQNSQNCLNGLAACDVSQLGPEQVRPSAASRARVSEAYRMRASGRHEDGR